MASKEQIERILVLMENAHPTLFLKRMNDNNAGIGAVLRFLYTAQDRVTAGQISRFMEVSTARVAVLLKKMEGKGLIIKSTGENDARTTIVTLSPIGRKTVERLREDLCAQIDELIDRIGMERLLGFISVAKEIGEIIKCPAPELIPTES